MTDTEPGPITNQEITAAADRIAHALVTYALSEIRDLLGDGIGETIADDQDANRLDSQARGIVYGLVWDRLGAAGAEYQRRDQADTAPLAEVVLAAEADALGREVERLTAAMANHRDQVLTEAAEIAERGASCGESCGCPRDPDTARGAGARIRAARTAAPAEEPEVVRCGGHCPNAELFERAVERGWQTHMGTWVCPTHAARTTTAQES